MPSTNGLTFSIGYDRSVKDGIDRATSGVSFQIAFIDQDFYAEFSVDKIGATHEWHCRDKKGATHLLLRGSSVF